jgi:peptidoglycan LD-endopeptidase CwlK
MASRRLEDLHPDMQSKAKRFVELCARENIDVLIYCTWRSPQEQKELYAIGRSKPGKKVTWTLASKHNNMLGKIPASLAFDCVPLRMGKPDWEASNAYERMGQIGEKLGLVWGGRWRGKDTPHFEM